MLPVSYTHLDVYKRQANNRAVALADEIGNDKVVNGTVGSILDEEGNLAVLDVVLEAYKRLTPRQICAYAPIKGYRCV